MNMVKAFGFLVFSDSMNKIIISKKETSVLMTISPNSYGISTKDPLFREALKKSDYLVLDGVYFCLSSILLQRKNIKKNQGPEVFYHFMDRINRQHGKVFFLGASSQTLEKMQKKATADYPNLTIGIYSPPFKEVFSEEDTKKMIEEVNSFKPDVLFIGMTCPKQEKWAYQNKLKLKTKLICCVGGVFDWYAGNQKIIAPFWWKLRLGWFVRTIHRPEILKRYPNIAIFFWHLLLALFGNKKYKYGSF